VDLLAELGLGPPPAPPAARASFSSDAPGSEESAFAAHMREGPATEQAGRSSGRCKAAGEQRGAFASGEGATPGHRTDPERGAPPAGGTWPPALGLAGLDSASLDFPTLPPSALPAAEPDEAAPQESASPVRHDLHGHAQLAATSAAALASEPTGDEAATMGPETTASSEVTEGRTDGPSSGKSGGLLREPAPGPEPRPVPVVPEALATAPPSDAPRNGGAPGQAASPPPEAAPTRVATDEAPAAPMAGVETNALSSLQQPAGATAASGISAAPSALPASPGPGAAGASSPPRPPIGELGRSVGPRSAYEPGDSADGGERQLRARGEPPDSRVASHARGSDESNPRQPAADAQIARLPQLSGAPSGAAAIAPPPTPGELGQAVTRGAEGVATAAGPNPAARQVALQISRALDQDRTEIRIQLDPPELGEVDIRLEFRELRLSATVSAERADTLDLLQRDARTLARALREAGVELADSDLSFTSGGRHDRPDAGAAGQRAMLLAHPLATPAPLLDGSLAAARPDGFVSLSDGRMDLRV